MPNTSTLQEVVLVQHFSSPLPLNILDMADWANTFSEYPNIQQLPFAAPADLTNLSPINLTFTILPPEMPRVLLRSNDGDRAVQFQADRFAFGWSRNRHVGEIVDYPGFDTLKIEWAAAWKKFITWHTVRFGTRPTQKLVELGYNNAAPIELRGKRRRLSDIFRWVQPSRPVNGFQVAWTELMERGRPDGARVNALVAVGAVPPMTEALIFNFTGFAPVDAPGGDALAFDSLHGRILDMYESAIIADGREDGT